MRRNSFSILFLSLLQLLSTKSETPLAPALYVIGDSLSDSGNNNGLVTLAKSNYYPYGIDFPAGATGRFSNGKTVADMLAEKLGLPYPPPYLGLSQSQRSTTKTGVNYASSGAGILPETGSALGQLLTYDQQLDFFASTINDDLKRQFPGSTQLNEYLSKAIFMVSIGSNDYINNYLQPALYDSSRRYNGQEFAQLLINNLSLGLQKLYSLGIRKMVVFEIGPVGCIPSQTNTPNRNGSCVDQPNQLVSLFNTILSNQLQQLQANLSGLIIVRGLIYDLSIDAKQNPSQYGFTNVDGPCCKSVGSALACLPVAPPCTNRDQYFFYDVYHPTEAVNSIVATGCFDQGTSVCSPINLKQLAQR